MFVEGPAVHTNQDALLWDPPALSEAEVLRGAVLDEWLCDQLQLQLGHASVLDASLCMDKLQAGAARFASQWPRIDPVERIPLQNPHWLELFLSLYQLPALLSRVGVCDACRT